MRHDNLNKRGWFRKITPVFILTALAIIFFSETLFGNKLFAHRDLSRYFYPLREFSVSEFQAGRAPLWNPYIHCGSPHLAELQTSVFYPLSAVYLIPPYPRSFNYFIILHILLAGIFMYMLMREWGHSSYASFFSGAMFMFSGYMISVINLLASLAAVTWLPLVILFYDRGLKKDWLKNSVITGIFLTLMFLGGEPIILYATMFILLFFTFPTYEVGFIQPRRLERLMVRFKPLIVAFLVFLGLAGFQILPSIEFLRNSSRVFMDFREASMWSMPPYALLDLLVPFLSEADYLYKDYWARQSWLLVYYMGISTAIFAFISLKFESSGRRRAMFYVLMAGILLAFGSYTPIYRALYGFLPGFSLSRYPVKFFFMTAFSLAVLAGMGIDYYINNAGKNKRLEDFSRFMLAAGTAASFLYLILNLNFSGVQDFLLKTLSGFSDNADTLKQIVYTLICNVRRALGIFMILSLMIFFGTRKNARVPLIAAVFLALSLFDVFTSNAGVYQNIDIDKYSDKGDTIRFLKEDRSLFRTFDSPSALRQNMYVPEKDYFEGMDALKERLVSNRGVSWQIYDAYGYGSVYNKRHEEVMDIIIRSTQPAETNLLNLLNVKYVISPKDFQAKGYSMVKKGRKANIYENANFLPRAFLADKAVVIKDEKKILKKLKSKDFNPQEEVILEETPIALSLEPRASSKESVDVVKYSPQEVIIKADVKDAKFLILSDSYYPGWRVYVDGKRDRIYRADYILRAVYLEPGKHIIKFIYMPFSFIIGIVISFTTIIIIFSIMVVKTCVQTRIGIG